MMIKQNFFMDIENNTRAHGNMEFLFSCSTQYLTSVLFCLLYTHSSLTRSQFNSCFKKRMCRHSFMALNTGSDMSATDWLSQILVKNYYYFSSVEISQ